MVSLVEQMQQLQKQQAELAKKIIREEERQRKLISGSTIERLEALIEPITQKLDYLPVNGSNKGSSYRHILENPVCFTM